MTFVVTPTQEQVYEALQPLVLDAVPDNVEVIQGLDNRVSMPPADPGFVAMTSVLQQRLRTNIDRYEDPIVTPGNLNAEQGTRLTIQLDCYGATSGDWAVILSTLLRSDYAVGRLAPDVAPLFAEEPRLAPLVDSEKQYEQRWIVGAVLQYNPVTVTPIEFADTLQVDLVNVDERYPPT